ncbi:MAG: hypothetical protein WKG07_48740 [Hymenobacter sp.]
MQQLVGIDVFLRWDGIDPNELGHQLETLTGHRPPATAQAHHQPRREGVSRRPPRNVLH